MGVSVKRGVNVPVMGFVGVEVTVSGWRVVVVVGVGDSVRMNVVDQTGVDVSVAVTNRGVKEVVGV